MAAAQRSLDLLHVDKYSQYNINRKAAWHDRGDKSGKRLDTIAKEPQALTVVSGLVLPSGVELQDPQLTSIKGYMPPVTDMNYVLVNI